MINNSNVTNNNVSTAFPPGVVVATPAALAALQESQQRPQDFLQRHVQGDWGEVCPDDARANDEALCSAERLVSSYVTRRGVKLWVITEADRSATTILLPDEY